MNNSITVLCLTTRLTAFVFMSLFQFAIGLVFFVPTPRFLLVNMSLAANYAAVESRNKWTCHHSVFKDTGDC